MRLVPRLPALRGIAELVDPPLLPLSSSLAVRSEPPSSLWPDRKVEALVVGELDAAGEPHRPPVCSRGRSGWPASSPPPPAPCGPLLVSGPPCLGAGGRAFALFAGRPRSARLRRLRCLERDRLLALASVPWSLSAAARSAHTTAAGPALALAEPPAAAACRRPPLPTSLRPSSCRAGALGSAGWPALLAGRLPGCAGPCRAEPGRSPLARSDWPQRPRTADRLRLPAARRRRGRCAEPARGACPRPVVPLLALLRWCRCGPPRA